MSHRPQLNLSPSLVQLAGNPWGKAFESVGNSLVTLGQQRVDEAKEKAAKQEADTKAAALQRAQASKNMVQNPSAVRAVHKRYGSDPDGPLGKPGAPSLANADLSMVDFGPEREAKVPKAIHSYKGEDGYYYSEMDDGTTRKSSVPFKAETPKAPTTKDININGANYVHAWKPDQQKWVNTGMKSAVYNTPSKNVAPNGKVPMTGLGSEGMSYIWNNQLFEKVGDAYFVDPAVLEKAKKIEQTGKIEVN